MEQKKNKFYFLVFIFIILVIVIGGFVYTYYMINKPKQINKEPKPDIVELKDSRIIKSKDYIYFENGEELDEVEEIFYEEIVININNQKSIQDTLNSENENYKNSIVRTDEEFNLPYRIYEIIEFDKYISLIIKDYVYNKEDHLPRGMKGYIFNKEEGTLVSEEQILLEYKTSLDNLKKDIRSKIAALRIETDLLDETMNTFNHFVYVNKIGNLEISYLVKSTSIDYYDRITLD